MTVQTGHWLSYSGRRAARLWRGTPAILGKMMLLSFALACGGCSMSNHFDMFDKSRDEARSTTGQAPEEQTASLGSAEQSLSSKVELPRDGDLAYTRQAVSELLTKGAKDSSVSWENPRTGARGTVTPIATAYNLGGSTCRDFLASYVRNGDEAWLQGEACSGQKGKWEVRSLKPWKRS